MRIFIHNIDSYVGRALAKELRRGDGGLNRIFGTAMVAADAPPVVKRLVSREDPKKAKKMAETLESCKLIILDLMNCSIEDLHFAISSLKVDFRSSPPKANGELENDVVFVLISSLRVWANTEVTSVDGYLRDSDFQRRRPVPGSKYELWKECEDLVLSCFNREGGSQVKAFVVSGGALYGDGEDSFKSMFEDAWQGVQPQSLKLPGSNRIPTVHVRDMARLVKQISVTADGINPLESTPFFLAVDQPPIPAEPAVEPVEATAGVSPEETEEKGAEEAATEQAPDQEGGGKATAQAPDQEAEEQPAVEVPVRKPKPSTQAEVVQGIINEVCEPYTVSVSEEVATIESHGDLALDLVVEPSAMMLDPEFASFCEPPGWVCKEGLVARVRTIAQEFCVNHGLRPMRVIIGGPPASGKSTLAKLVAEHFKLPHLVLPHQENMASVLEQMLQSLSSNVCRYRGYVLDAGVIGSEEVDRLFQVDVEVPPDEEEAPPPADEEGEGAAPPKKFVRQLREELSPQFVIVTQAPAPLCRARSKGSSDASTFDDRMQKYIDKNLTDGVSSLADFFQTVAKIGVLNLPVAGKDEQDIFESVRIFMESAGRPFNFLPSEREVATQIRAQREAQDKAAKDKEAVRLNDKSEAEIEAADEARFHEHRVRVVEDHLQKQADLTEMPLRQYLLQYLVSNLTEGLIEVCKALPEDPVDYLATYLEQQAKEGS